MTVGFNKRMLPSQQHWHSITSRSPDNAFPLMPQGKGIDQIEPSGYRCGFKPLWKGLEEGSLDYEEAYRNWIDQFLYQLFDE